MSFRFVDSVRPINFLFDTIQTKMRIIMRSYSEIYRKLLGYSMTCKIRIRIDCRVESRGHCHLGTDFYALSNTHSAKSLRECIHEP